MTVNIVIGMVIRDQLKPVNVTVFRHVCFITGSSYCFARESNIC